MSAGVDLTSHGSVKRRGERKRFLEAEKSLIFLLKLGRVE